MNKLQVMYKQLLDSYGPQGWWPLLDCIQTHRKNPTKTGSLQGYHPGDYSYPKNDKQKFEICVGAILTQNTNWVNVEKALLNLQGKSLLTPEKISSTSEIKLAQLIKPSGYFNQKVKKLKVFASFYLSLKKQTPTREQLLNLWGIGPETADSMLLYAYKQPEFVIDAYTKRILLNKKIITKDASYDTIKHLFQSSLPKDVSSYQEFHALLVEEGKHLQ